MPCIRIRRGIVCVPEPLPRPKDRPDLVDEGCGPNKRGMLAWMNYAEEMTRSHRQQQCPTCGRWHIWVKRARYRRPAAKREG
jgi:hypothetical protein